MTPGAARQTMPGESQPRLFHRFPFVLSDRCLEARHDAATASRLVSIDDALLEGGAGPSLSQALLVEAMAQTAALFAEEEGRRRSGMLVGLRGVSFGRPPRPGDRLVVEARLVQRYGGLVRVAGRVTESGEEIAAGEIVISLSESASGPGGGRA